MAHSVLHQLSAFPSNNDVATYCIRTGSTTPIIVQYYRTLKRKLESFGASPLNFGGFSIFTDDGRPVGAEVVAVAAVAAAVARAFTWD